MSSEGAKLMRVVWVGLKRLETQDMAPQGSITKETYLLNARKMITYRNKVFLSYTTLKLCRHCTWSRVIESTKTYGPRSDLILSGAKTSANFCPFPHSVRVTTYTDFPRSLLLVYGNAYQKTEVILSGIKHSLIYISHHEARSDILGFLSSSFDRCHLRTPWKLTSKG